MCPPLGTNEENAMPTPAINRRLDLRGHVCPGPTVDTRLTLKEMAPDEVLEVVTDYSLDRRFPL